MVNPVRVDDDAPVPGTCAIHLDGVLDVAAAARVAHRVGAVPELGTVHVDLARVREFHDAAVVQLMRALAPYGARVTVVGLRQHHRRLLRHLGIDVDPVVLDREADAV